MQGGGQLSAVADIRGNIFATILQYNPLENQTEIGSGLRFKCVCSNHGRKACEISKACLWLSGEDFQTPLRLETALPLPCVSTVQHGQRFSCDGAGFAVRGVRLSQLNRSTISIYLIDSLGTEYRNTAITILSGPDFDRL